MDADKNRERLEKWRKQYAKKGKNTFESSGIGLRRSARLSLLKHGMTTSQPPQRSHNAASLSQTSKFVNSPTALPWTSWYNRYPDMGKLKRSLRHNKIGRFKSMYNCSFLERKTIIHHGGAPPVVLSRENTSGIMWVAVGVGDRLCVAFRKKDLKEERITSFKNNEGHVKVTFGTSIVSHIEELARDELVDLSYKGKKPFAVVSVPWTGTDPCDALGEKSEKEAIKFLTEKINFFTDKMNANFTIPEIVQSAITALQILLEVKFKAGEVEVCGLVRDDMYGPTYARVTDHLDYMNNPDKYRDIGDLLPVFLL